MWTRDTEGVSTAASPRPAQGRHRAQRGGQAYEASHQTAHDRPSPGVALLDEAEDRAFGARLERRLDRRRRVRMQVYLDQQQAPHHNFSVDPLL